MLMTMIAAMALSAAGQDVLGPVNPTDYTPAITMGSAIEADARSSSRRRSSARSSTRSSQARRTCSSLPSYRVRYGRSNPKIVKMTQLCAGLGYR